MSIPALKLPRLVQAAHAAIDPEGFFRLGARRGDPFRVRLPGVGEIHVTGHPDGARDVFTADPETFATVPQNPIEALLGPGSLILRSGASHTRERRLLLPPFHGDRMRAYGETMRAATLAALARLRPGAPFVAQELTRAITLQVIVRAVFGIEGERERAASERAVLDMLAAYTPPLMLVPALRRSLGGAGPWARFVRARAAFDALLREQIARRRAAPGEDILSLLVAARHDDGSGLAEAELLDELRTLLVAGHDTSAGALAWALYYLHARPELAERARSAGSEYVAAVVSEALRLHPVVPIVLRRLRAPLVLRGTRLPAGANVAVATSLLHARADLYPEPRRFDPERFVARRYSPFEYAPFGGGHRRCLGAAFATFELRTVLETLLAHGRFALAGGQRAPRPVLQGITSSANRDIRMTYEGRVQP